jgi:hypothetical protein
MTEFRFLSAALIVAALAVGGAGCIRGDETKTFYLSDDGKVDVVYTGDNLHSGEKTEEGRKKEEAEWLRDFRVGKVSEIRELKEGKARNLKSYLLRDHAPFSAVVRASLDSIDQFGRIFDFNKPDSKNILKLVRDGKQRKLVFHIGDHGSKPESPKKETESTDDSFLTWKIVPVGGRITAATACVINADHSACVLDMKEVTRLDRTGADYEITVSWEQGS